MNERRTHWENVYSTKGEADVSWFQETPAISLELLAVAGAKPADAVIDVGGGASRLVDSLLDKGFTGLAVLDLSEAALAAARARLGKKGDAVEWIAADATAWEPREAAYDIWHDRAAFHFLTEHEDQAAYIERLKLGLRKGGHVIIGTFAPDGPEKCSGLPVARHDADSLGGLLGKGFTLIDHRRHEHVTPWGSIQKFQFSTFRRDG
ncbi:class I SAM-dependent methyltransferase [Rhizobium sp. LjRoot254]|uniref:class I SAM-dependent methyltransferase n=1 Tax=Rhizobium sp. LjRoot254 TaxID=3342297 RepID=UPI003ECCC6D6